MMITPITTPIPSTPSFSLRLQLTLAFGLLCVLMTIVGAATLWGIFSLSAAANQAVEVDGYLSRLSSDVSIKTLLCRRYEKDFFLNLADQKTRNDYLTKWNNAFTGLNQAIGGFDAAATKPEDKQLAATWRKDSAAYQTAFLSVVQQIENNTIATSADANAALTPSKDSIRRLTDTSTATAESSEVAAQQAAKTLADSSTQTTWMVVALLVLILLAAIVWSILFPARLMRPVTALQIASSRIAGGDLTVKVNANRNDELGILAHTFNHMTDTIRKQVDDLQLSNDEIKRLQEAEANKRRLMLEQAVGQYLDFARKVAQGDLTERISVEYEGALGELGAGLNTMVASLHDITCQVQEGTNAIAAAVAQISAATTEQAASAAQQSAAITETATAIEQVKVIALQTADQATQLAQTSQNTLDIARQSDDAVSQTIGGMGQIRQQMSSIDQTIRNLSEHTRSISTIIASVSELADQINNLAQNAAIESTRSGDQDRDVATLAQLVRDLGSQAKQSTGQVRQILLEIQGSAKAAVTVTGAGLERVEADVQLVTATGTMLRQIAGDVQGGAQANVQMAAAAQQQTLGMEQIAQAMTAIQQAMTQTLVGTRQAEQAAHGLLTLAQSLQQAIAVYRL
jgi:methyl-accepting chemotaxis protein